MRTRVRPCVFCLALLSFCSTFLLLSGCGSAANISTGPNPLKSRALTSITIAPGTSSVTAGQDLQFTATGSFDDNSTGPIPGSIRWSTSTTAAFRQRRGLAAGLRPRSTSSSPPAPEA